MSLAASPYLSRVSMFEDLAMIVPADWWRTFFQGIVVDFWLAVPTLEQTKSDVDFVLKMTGIAHGAKVLDVPCGGGRHSVELASRGHEVTGVDFSQEFLKAAKTLDTEKRVEWVEAEMRELPWPNRFDAAMSLGNSFPYLDDVGNVAFLQAAAKTLKPGGKFVLETGAVAESLFPNYHERRWYDIGEILFAIKNEYDCELGRLNTTYVFVRDGQIETKYGTQRVYSCSQLITLLRGVGFAQVDLFSNMQGASYKLGSQALILVATKGVEDSAKTG